MTLARFRRGFTLSELLVISGALAIFLGLAIATLFPVLTYIIAGQAKIDTQANAVPVLYRLQREIRIGDARAVYYRATPTSSAAPLPSTLTSVTTFAIASAKQNASGDSCYPGAPFDMTSGTGQPLWHGFDVFTLSNDGTLNCVFEALAASTWQLPTAAQADTAMTAGLAVTNPPLFGHAVFNVQMAAETPQISGRTVTTIDLKIQALSTVSGRTNATTYTQNILTRR